DPSLRVALALAQALGMTVEELFGAEGTVASVSARLVGQDTSGASPVVGASGKSGARVTLAPVGNHFVAPPLAGPTVRRAGFLPAGGRLAYPPGEQAGRSGERTGKRPARHPEV